MTDYTEYQVESAPSFLQRPWGRALNYALGLTKDGIRQAAKDAVKARFVSIAPLDALDGLLRDFDLPGRFDETLAQTRARIADAWRTWQLAGTAAGIVHALNVAGYPNVLVAERLSSARWWDFRVTLRAPFPWDPAAQPALVWGSGWTWDQGFHFTGASETEAQKARVLALIAKWKPAHAQLREVAVQIYGPYWGEFAWGDGTPYGGLEDLWQ